MASRTLCGLGRHLLARQQGLVRRASPRAYLNTSTALYKLCEFQETKIIGEFDRLYDRDKDGFVTKKDIADYKKAMKEHFAQTRGRHHKDFDKGPGYDEYWILFTEMADANHDGKLSRKEWLDIWTKIDDSTEEKSFKNLPQWVQLMPRTIFPIIDFKGDHDIDVDEYKEFWYQVGGVSFQDEGTLSNIFKAMTKNGSIPLNLERFQDLYADFYFSRDPTTPGRYMAGPVE